MKSNIELVKHCKEVLNSNCCYIYGTFGQQVTSKLIADKAAQYPKQMTPQRVDIANKIDIGKTAYDCSGLIKSFLMDGKYNADQDRNAKGMYNNCTKSGLISNIPDIPGVLVFNKSLTHVGVYIGNNQVIEAKGFDYGIRKANVSNFYYWGMYKEIDYTNDSTAKTDAPDNSYKAKIITISGLNIRSGAGVSYSKIGAYNYGTAVNILEESGDWARTNRGWICLREDGNEYVKRVNSWN